MIPAAGTIFRGRNPRDWRVAAVYTDVSAEDLAGFLAGYDIGELLSYKGIAEGVENSNFLLQTSAGHFILTLYEKRVAPEDLPLLFLGPMEHLAARGLTCPQPVGPLPAAMLGFLAGRPAAIVTFLEGHVDPPAPVPCTPARWARRWRSCIWQARISPEAPQRALRSMAGVRSTSASAVGGRQRAARACASHRARGAHILKTVWPSSLPEGVIHADLFPDNVFFLGDRSPA